MQCEVGYRHVESILKTPSNPHFFGTGLVALLPCVGPKFSPHKAWRDGVMVSMLRTDSTRHEAPYLSSYCKPPPPKHFGGCPHGQTLCVATRTGRLAFVATLTTTCCPWHATVHRVAPCALALE